MFAGRRDSTIPPRRLNISGGGSFRTIGEHNLMLCKTFGSLHPTDTVLDLGCGIGRTALAMTTFLEAEGRYSGLDIVKFAIQWCQANIARQHANFAFFHANVRNQTYNPGGKFYADEFSFPFASASFDFCLATSLFTHLLPTDTERYIREVSRVLRKDGRFLSTWFLLDEQTSPTVNAGKSLYSFPFAFDLHAQMTCHTPEEAIAYYGSSLRQMFARAGLEIEAIHYGGWSGFANSIDSGQDVVIARRLSK